MQISIETTKGLERRLTISVPSEQFEEQISDRLGNTATQVKLPGFRPGRVPLKEIRRRYGPAVRAEIAGELMQSSFVEAIQRESLAPAGSPNLEVVKMDPGIDFEFTATFEVFPVVDLVDLSRVVVKKPEAEITEDDLDQMVERLRDQRSEQVPVDGPAEHGHKVTIDFSGTLDGEPFEGGSGEGVSFVIGAGQMIEDFDRGVIGLGQDETGEFPATFPEDYQAEELRGKTATFSVTVKEITKAQRPELDEEFFAGFGIEEGGEAAFLADVRENMNREMEAAAQNQVKSQVMDRLFELHSVQLPNVVVSNEIAALKAQMMQQFQGYGQGQAPAIDLPDDLFTEQAERRVTVGLVVNEIVKAADIQADPELVKARIETLAAGYAEPQQVINYYMSNPEQRQQIEMAVLEEQVVDHILDKGRIEIVPSNYNDVISGQAVAPAEEEFAATGDGEDAEELAAVATEAQAEDSGDRAAEPSASAVDEQPSEQR